MHLCDLPVKISLGLDKIIGNIARSMSVPIKYKIVHFCTDVFGLFLFVTHSVLIDDNLMGFCMLKHIYMYACLCRHTLWVGPTDRFCALAHIC